MSFSVRDGKFDVLIAAGPRLQHWPSIGARTISALCGEMGLTVGYFGGDLRIYGVLPLPDTGGLVLAEDPQHRIHRIRASAVVRLSNMISPPDPFEGWRSPGLVPLSTAIRLREESEVTWNPTTVILGTGNQALRFGSSLLEREKTRWVYCLESYVRWKGKRYSGWEVERRRFEMLGGKILEAKPISLKKKSGMIWQLRVQDSVGVRVLNVARVISAGPFTELSGIKEHPPGAFLYELDQTASETREEDVEGWSLEEERARWLAAKISKSLVIDLGDRRERLESILKRSRSRVRRSRRHREEPMSFSYQGKWIGKVDSDQVRSFKGVPKARHRFEPTASIECFEDIPCNLCEKACPELAIQIVRGPKQKESFLIEDRCTACGVCLQVCPSGAPVILSEKEDHPTSPMIFSWRGVKLFEEGEFATLVNREGAPLGSVRVKRIVESSPVQLLEVDVPTHLIWEGRGLRRVRGSGENEEGVDSPFLEVHKDEIVEITLNGEKRLVREGLPISIALFEVGRSRSEDILLCPDGSCNLCHVLVDGVKKLACQTKIHGGMTLKIGDEKAENLDQDLCPCLNVTKENITQRIHQGRLSSPEAVLAVTHVGKGRCHGQLCRESFRRLLIQNGVDVSNWVDWRFPWTEWVMQTGPTEPQ